MMLRYPTGWLAAVSTHQCSGVFRMPRKAEGVAQLVPQYNLACISFDTVTFAIRNGNFSTTHSIAVGAPFTLSTAPKP